MKKKLVVGALVATMGVLSVGQGCSTFPGPLGPELWEMHQKAQQKAIKDGVPRQELERLLDEAIVWIEQTAPNDDGVMNASYKKIFVVGGTLNESNAGNDGLQSVSDEEVNIRTRRLFNTLRSKPAMNANFKFFDRTDDFNIDLSAYTGDTSQYGSVLSDNGGGDNQYAPEDIYYLKLAFEEIQKLNQNPAWIEFTLTVSIEWGGNPGDILHSNIFESGLVFKKELMGGKWVREGQE